MRNIKKYKIKNSASMKFIMPKIKQSCQIDSALAHLQCLELANRITCELYYEIEWFGFVDYTFIDSLNKRQHQIV